MALLSAEPDQDLFAYALVALRFWVPLVSVHLGRFLEVLARLASFHSLLSIALHQLRAIILLLCLHVAWRPQVVLADPFDVEGGRVLYRRVGHALHVQFLCPVSPQFERWLLGVHGLLQKKLPLGLALLEEAPHRVLPSILSGRRRVRVGMVLSLRHLLRPGSGLRVLLRLGAKLRDLLPNRAREEHAAGLWHELLLLALMLIQDALQEGAVGDLVAGDQGREVVRSGGIEHGTVVVGGRLRRGSMRLAGGCGLRAGSVGHSVVWWLAAVLGAGFVVLLGLRLGVVQRVLGQTIQVEVAKLADVY